VEGDLVVYVSLFDEPKNPYAAFATACAFDKDQNYRPVIGGVQINLAYVEPNPFAYQAMVNLMVHELAHVLAFSNKHYKYYVDEVGNRLGKENVIEK